MLSFRNTIEQVHVHRSFVLPLFRAISPPSPPLLLAFFPTIASRFHNSVALHCMLLNFESLCRASCCFVNLAQDMLLVFQPLCKACCLSKLALCASTDSFVAPGFLQAYINNCIRSLWLLDVLSAWPLVIATMYWICKIQACAGCKIEPSHHQCSRFQHG